jgi:2'-hydroxyisoflavone reductase
MQILIIGGKKFLGKALVDAALAHNHQLSLFNRGQTNPQWFPNIETLTGDRNNDLSALEGRHWDAVIDTCAYFPRQVNELLKMIAQKTGYYTFISSISVYADFSQPGLHEGSPVAVLDNLAVEEVTGDTYGGLKALCEKAAEQTMPGKNLIIRPGLIVGPYDPTDRFTYWPVRVSKGGEVLAPDSPDWDTQVIDVRDLAEWTLRCIEARICGVFNATGPAEPLTFGEVLDISQSVSNGSAKITWVETEFLRQRQVKPWSDLPLWLPDAEDAGGSKVNIDKAVQHGLSFRSLDDTIRDTLDWAATRPPEYSFRAGLAPERENEILAEWHAANKEE